MAYAVRTSVAVLGAGSQGRRLAYMWSSRGNDVHLIDEQTNQLQASLQAVERLRLAQKPKGNWGRIKTHSAHDLKEALSSSWLVVECVPERLLLKKQVVSKLDSLAPGDTIIASNSSSYSCGEIVNGLALNNERRVLSAHTYWPPETSVIEIMGHDNSDTSCIDIVMEQAAVHGFTPFHVKSHSMGYIYNRIWAAIKREALLAAAEGAGTPEEIDAIFRGVLKTPKGPFELMDIVGLDVVLDIERHYASARQGIPSQPQQYLDKYLQNGYLGVKSGRGFYTYDNTHAT